MKILLANEVLDAGTALKLGLVHRVVARDSLEEASLELAESLSNVPPALSAAIKRSVADGLDMNLRSRPQPGVPTGEVGRGAKVIDAITRPDSSWIECANSFV